MVVRRPWRSFVGAVVVLLAACSSTTGERTDVTRSTLVGQAPSSAVTLAPTAAPTLPPTTPVPTVAPTTPAPTATPTLPATTPAPTAPVAPPTTTVPAVDAAAYAVYDQRSGTLLAASNADAPLAVGSLMKLLTAQAVYAAGDPVKIVTVPAGLIIDPLESQIGLFPGQQLQRDTLTRAMLIVSANDAARALAIDIAGSEAALADQMNLIASGLGLANTRAANVTGLDADGQYSSANDMVRLGASLMGNQTFQLTVERLDATLNERTLPATNDLLRLYPGADGIKTGRTTQAGWCILASADRAGRRIIVAVLGAPTEEARNAAAISLLDWGFTQ